MASFIMAMNLTSGARKSHADISQRIAESLEVFTKENIKVHSLYATLGRYDCLAIFEAEDHKLAFKIASEINGQGVLETETWPVIPFEEFSRLVG